MTRKRRVRSGNIEDSFGIGFDEGDTFEGSRKEVGPNLIRVLRKEDRDCRIRTTFLRPEGTEDEVEPYKGVKTKTRGNTLVEKQLVNQQASK